MKTAYPIVIEWSKEDACYIAHSPVLKYCSAHGDTYEEAAREMTTAMELWLKASREEGLPIPDPSGAPDLFNYFLDASELQNIAAIARGLGMSPQTLHSKVRRRSPFSRDQAAGLERLLRNSGLQLGAKSGGMKRAGPALPEGTKVLKTRGRRPHARAAQEVGKLAKAS